MVLIQAICRTPPFLPLRQIIKVKTLSRVSKSRKSFTLDPQIKRTKGKIEFSLKVAHVMILLLWRAHLSATNSKTKIRLNALWAKSSTIPPPLSLYSQLLLRITNNRKLTRTPEQTLLKTTRMIKLKIHPLSMPILMNISNLVGLRNPVIWYSHLRWWRTLECELRNLQ
jgi:hypothetical protein